MDKEKCNLVFALRGVLNEETHSQLSVEGMPGMIEVCPGFPVQRGL